MTKLAVACELSHYFAVLVRETPFTRLIKLRAHYDNNAHVGCNFSKSSAPSGKLTGVGNCNSSTVYGI